MADHAVPLRESDADPDPLEQFTRWFADARAAGIRAPEAAAVATSTSDGAPSVRMVLIKQADDRGFVFFTNLESRKGAELAENPRAAVLFHWDPLGRQVRIEGRVEPVDRKEVIAYARSRPRASQISAVASPQSRVIAGREELEAEIARVAERHPQGEPPVPEHWGGFRVVPERYEFWQSRADRLHDRLQYVRTDGGWGRVRLAP